MNSEYKKLPKYTGQIIINIFFALFSFYSGAIKESRVLLTAYGLFIIIIALLQITAIVLAVININDAKEKTKQYFTWTIEKYYTTKEQRDAVTLSWDFMMAEVCIFQTI